MDDKNISRGFKVVLILPTILALIAGLLDVLYSLPVKETLFFYTGVFIFFYIPGNLLLKHLDFQDDEYFVSIFHSVALGFALIPLLYINLRRISHPEFIYVFGLAIFLFWIIRTARDIIEKRIIIHTSFQDILSVSVLIGFIILLLHLTYFTDIVFLKTGFKIRNIFFIETDFNLGIVNVLKESCPPFYPYASGADFSYYHYYMQLQIEMINRIFAIDTLKLTFYYFPLLYFIMLVFMPFMIIKNSYGLRFFSVLAGVLIIGSDFSFIPGLLGIYPSAYPWQQYLDYPWALFFRSTIWSLLSLNGVLPGLSVMFLSFMYLDKYIKNERLVNLVMFAILGFSAFGFKSSIGPHIMGSALIAGIISVVWMRENKKGKNICLFAGIAILIMVADVFLFRGGTGNVIAEIDLLNNFKQSLLNLRLESVPKVFYPVLFIIYMIASFGIKTGGFYLIKGIFQRKPSDIFIVFLIIFSLSGFLLADAIYLGMPFHIENNAMWFAVQSLIASWLLIVYFLIRLQQSRAKIFLSVAIVLLLSAPTTVQFLYLRSDNNYYNISSNAIEVVKYLQKTPPKSVVLHPNESGGISLASNLAGRSSVISYLHSHVMDFIGCDETNKRLINVEMFFDSRKDVDRLAILKKYNVDYIYAPLKYDPGLDKEIILDKVLMNEEYAVYKVHYCEKEN